MSKKLKNLKWESVALSGFPASMTENLEGFVGLEECTSYGLEKDNSSRNKKKKQTGQKNASTEESCKKKTNKRKNSYEENQKPQIPSKKLKLSNGFVVESCNKVTPSITNEIGNTVIETLELTNKKVKKRSKKNKRKAKLSDKTQNKDNKEESIENELARNVNSKNEKMKPSINVQKDANTKNAKMKLGEDISQTLSNLTPEDMLTWAEFKLPEPIIRALMELGFKKPTKIQELSLPAAIHGRRDILGAAETGSGKTLAFGLPILNGIMKLKEKAEAGLDVYEISYKKTSVKKKCEKELTKKVKKSKEQKKVDKAKESSEDGYESGDDEEEKNNDNNERKVKSIKDKPTDLKKNAKVKASIIKSKTDKEDDFIEEIEVPIRRKEASVDEGNDSDSDNYVHVSDMLDSDDLADASDDAAESNDDESVDDDSDDLADASDDAVESNDDESESNDNDSVQGGNDSQNVDDLVKSNDSESGQSDDDNEEKIDDEVNEDSDDENNKGIGCVKVIDNVEMPGHVVTKTGKPLYALILTPTRELAIQISRHLIAVAKYTGIRIATIVGGMAAVKQERVLQKGPEVVVATPGRLWELINQGESHLQQLENVKFLAIDETDRMIERGHFEELQPLLERLNADDEKRGSRQNFVFSATLTMVHDLPAHMRGKKVTKRGKIINRKIDKMTPQQKIKRLVNMIGMTDPKVVDITTQNLGTAETLTESRIACSIEMKDAYLYYILKRHPGRTIVFCNTIGCVRRLAQLFTLLKCHPLPLHASMPQRQRLKNLERFRDDPHGVLVATDVAARGLDIPNIDHVIHYQVPKTAENYVHRSGRTARATKEGITILMMEPSEAYLYAKICRTLNKTAELPTFPVPPSSLNSLKELVSTARDLDVLELRKRRTTQAIGWRERVAREMDIIIDDDDIPVTTADPSIDKALKAKRRQLESMLSRPLFPRGFSFKYPTLNDPNMFKTSDDNALQVMKKALESGVLKKEKRTSKNAPLLKLQKTLNK